MPYANNKGANQPAHPHSLISTFIVRCLDSIMSLVSISEISSLKLAAVVVQAGFESCQVENPKDMLSRDEAQLHLSLIVHYVIYPKLSTFWVKKCYIWLLSMLMSKSLAENEITDVKQMS